MLIRIYIYIDSYLDIFSALFLYIYVYIYFSRRIGNHVCTPKLYLTSSLKLSDYKGPKAGLIFLIYTGRTREPNVIKKVIPRLFLFCFFVTKNNFQSREKNILSTVFVRPNPLSAGK
ncbi:unnamed protein product [Ixodes persulcatus]